VLQVSPRQIEHLFDSMDGMSAAFQGSLLDLGDDVAPAPLDGSVRRTQLGDGAWLDVRPGWLGGADVLFERLRQFVPWQAERRQMYERVVDVPRLLCFYGEGDPLPDPALDAAKAALDAYYGDELGEPFVTAGLCLYRDGRDSVAWHGDRIGRSRTEDTMVAIISVGAPRTLALRPRNGGAPANEGVVGGGVAGRAGGPARRFELGHGDLIVMGGSCQRTWEHAVPKTARPVGPRISIQFRTRGVR
jgi:alkylated DNA repair dioxygenase AlkB